eukprot:c14739_g1_i1 orf=1-849(-)
MEVHASEVMQQGIETTHNLLEFAAADDLEGFKSLVREYAASLNQASAWYHRHYASHKMGWHLVTPVMIASLYGNLEVLKFILSYISNNGGNVNTVCGAGKGTALHYAVAGCSFHAIETVRLLLSYGADVNVVDAHGVRPFDVMMASSRQCYGKFEMELLLMNGAVDFMSPPPPLQLASNHPILHVGKSLDDEWRLQSIDTSNDPIHFAHSPLSDCSNFSPVFSTMIQVPTPTQEPLERTKENPIEPPFSDVKNSIYTSDDFRMFSFKVRPCSRAYSHDWTECP